MGGRAVRAGKRGSCVEEEEELRSAGTGGAREDCRVQRMKEEEEEELLLLLLLLLGLGLSAEMLKMLGRATAPEGPEKKGGSRVAQAA
jgi:hypothetical protein